MKITQIFLVFSILYSLKPLTGQEKQLLESNVRKYRVPAVALAKITDTQIQYDFHGTNYDEQHIDISTIFQAASLSKPVFAMAFLKLLIKKNIPLNESVIHFLPSLTQFIQEDALKKITLEDLLMHRAGIKEINYPGYLKKEICTDALSSLSGIPDSHAKLRLINSPGTSFAYSGASYTILQMVAESITKLSFQEFMQTYLFKDIKDSNLSYNYEDIDQMKLASPHDIWGRKKPVRYFAEKAAAGLYCNIRDLSLVISDLISEKNNHILKLMINEDKFPYGRGIEIEKLKNNYHLAYHLGANIGWRSGLFIIPEKREGLIILCNSDRGNSLILKLAENWLNDLGIEQPQFIKSYLQEKLITKIIASIVGAFFVLRLSLLIVYCFLRKNVFKFSFFSFVRIFLLIFFLFLWLFIFFSPYSYPKHWTLAAFFTHDFIFLTIGLIACILLESVYSLVSD